MPGVRSKVGGRVCWSSADEDWRFCGLRFSSSYETRRFPRGAIGQVRVGPRSFRNEAMRRPSPETREEALICFDRIGAEGAPRGTPGSAPILVCQRMRGSSAVPLIRRWLPSSGPARPLIGGFPSVGMEPQHRQCGRRGVCGLDRFVYWGHRQCCSHSAEGRLGIRCGVIPAIDPPPLPPMALEQ